MSTHDDDDKEYLSHSKWVTFRPLVPSMEKVELGRSLEDRETWRQRPLAQHTSLP